MNIRYILNLRHIPRTGWLLRGVPPVIAESVAEHIFLTSIIAMDIAEKLWSRNIRLDKARTLSMSIIHDVPEAVTGDIIRLVKANAEEYFSIIESQAIKELGIQEYESLYNELSSGETLESIVVKVADDVATILEGRRLMEMGYHQVEEIIVNVEAHLRELVNAKTPVEVKGVLLEIVSEYLDASVFSKQK
ncbi:HD domain-containing protein [Desulfurococcus amylolyticus]|uniref:Metal dependent phosphohydrolase n=1 Tax=Desulfurococcus amylolyticus DSM 16532 TaxID=768672 RepID=I3XRB9_DESAM|nr:HD domain-containing protein [Desulfurococcus amylolyticus]AFL66493.1 metal dependent phosphohydrolase [Desulfurococcus amylolyticus DSM 16532]